MGTYKREVGSTIKVLGAKRLSLLGQLHRVEIQLAEAIRADQVGTPDGPSFRTVQDVTGVAPNTQQKWLTGFEPHPRT